MSYTVTRSDLSEVARIWNETWAKSGLTCRYLPADDKVIEWCSDHPLDLVLESIEDGVPNFIRRINGQPGDVVRPGNATWAINYVTGVLRNKATALRASTVIREAD